MKFGVYVRSIGERTEKLCLESCYQHIDSRDVHLLKNYFPSYNVYREMFKRAIKSDYDWFMGVDADVVLYKNWFEIVQKDIESSDPQKIFKFTYLLDDYILREPLDRGNHIYNNAFSKHALSELDKNIFITKLPLFLKKYCNRGRYLKPETSIRHKMKERYKVDNYNIHDKIGIHGAEQYLCHFFRAFALRAHRNPKYSSKYDFLRESNQESLLREGDIERYVANLGWNYGMKHSIATVDAGEIRRYEIILGKKGMSERDELTQDINWFYERYQGFNERD